MHKVDHHLITCLLGEGPNDSESVALTANFIFVARDYKTNKAAQVNRLTPETEQEKILYDGAEARDKVRKMKRGEDKKQSDKSGVNRLETLLSEGRIFCDMPALADRDSILLRDTQLENALICHPQQRNLHGRIFGGFLMHKAFELAFSTAYAFAGIVPSFLEVDHVDFYKPVSTIILSFEKTFLPLSNFICVVLFRMLILIVRTYTREAPQKIKILTPEMECKESL